MRIYNLARKCGFKQCLALFMSEISGNSYRLIQCHMSGDFKEFKLLFFTRYLTTISVAKNVVFKMKEYGALVE